MAVWEWKFTSDSVFFLNKKYDFDLKQSLKGGKIWYKSPQLTHGRLS